MMMMVTLHDDEGDNGVTVMTTMMHDDDGDGDDDNVA